MLVISFDKNLEEAVYWDYSISRLIFLEVQIYSTWLSWKEKFYFWFLTPPFFKLMFLKYNLDEMPTIMIIVKKFRNLESWLADVYQQKNNNDKIKVRF